MSVEYAWRAPVTDDEIVDLVVSHGGRPEAGCEWLHVDVTEDLSPFYLDACGFRPTAAGLVRLGR